MKFQQLTESLRAGYEMLIAGASSLKSPFLLGVRLYSGLQMFVAGSAHLADVPAMVERFQEWGVPLPTFNVYLSGTDGDRVWSLAIGWLRLTADFDSADRQLLRGLSNSEPGGAAECV